MSTLVLALYAEGATDTRFLPIIIRRTVERLVASYRRGDIDVLDVMVMNHDIKQHNLTQTERIVAAARKAAGYHGLIVHTDADAPARDRAYNERFAPGHAAVRAKPDNACNALIPLIPVHMVEAWMLADPEALRKVIGTATDVQQLGLPATARDIEADSDPKATLAHTVQAAISTRRRQRHFDISTISAPLAQLIQLEHLERLTAYQQFQRDLLGLLIDVHAVEEV